MTKKLPARNNPEKVTKVLALVRKEVESASAQHPPMNSAHEGWAVLMEEVDELWDEVKKKTKNRSVKNMQEEAVQVAAMAIRFYLDLL